MTQHHTDRAYEAELNALRSRLERMASLVERMIEGSMGALVARDSEGARGTIRLDREVNALELESDEACIRILARWQPMASDLRFLTFVLKTVTDLERIGDLAVNICERTIDLAEMPSFELPEELTAMGVRVQSMVHDAVQASLSGDADLAREVIERDDLVDEAYTHVFRDVLDQMRSVSGFVARGVHVQSVAKWLERMADHATNVAEQAIFLAEGNDVRHRGRRAAGAGSTSSGDAEGFSGT